MSNVAPWTDLAVESIEKDIQTDPCINIRKRRGEKNGKKGTSIVNPGK